MPGTVQGAGAQIIDATVQIEFYGDYLQGFGNLVADALVKLGQNFVIKGRADRLDELDALFRLEEFDDVGKVGRFEIAHELSGSLGLVMTECVRDGTDQVR